MGSRFHHRFSAPNPWRFFFPGSTPAAPRPSTLSFPAPSACAASSRSSHLPGARHSRTCAPARSTRATMSPPRSRRRSSSPSASVANARSPRSGFSGGVGATDAHTSTSQPLWRRVSASVPVSVSPSFGASRDASANASRASQSFEPSRRDECVRASKAGGSRGTAARSSSATASAWSASVDPTPRRTLFYSGAEVSSGVGSDGSDGWRRETESRATTRESNNEGGANLGDETYPPHTGRSHVTASATAKYANDTCAATRAAPSVDMVSARAPVRGPRL